MAGVDFDKIGDEAIEVQESSIDTDKLTYEIFSILESKFLFGCDDHKFWVSKPGAERRQPRIESVVVHGENGLPAMRNQRGKVCVLCVDGCGMHDVLSGRALSYLESALKNKSGNAEARIADYFDVAAGAGRGGILTAMLFATVDQNRPMFNAEDTLKFLIAEGTKFCRPAKIRSSKGSFIRRIFGKDAAAASSSVTLGLEKTMREAFKDTKSGRSLTLKDTLKPVLIPCYDLTSAAPFLFSRADALETDSYDFNLWETCMATAAQPGLFDPICMKSIDGLTSCVGVDGGLAMSNPTAAAITHVLHNKQEFPFVRGVEDILVLSLGAGGQLLDGSFEYDPVSKCKGADWARISGHISAELIDNSVAMAFGHNRCSNYVRIQANGHNNNRFTANADSHPDQAKRLIEAADDTLKQKNVESILFGGKRVGEQSNLEKLDWFAEQLVLEHRRRSFRIAPTVSFKRSTPKP